MVFRSGKMLQALLLVAALTMSSAMDMTIAGGGTLRDSLGMNLRKQLKSAAFGAAGALMRSSMAEDDEDDSRPSDSTIGAVVAAVTIVADLDGAFKVPHFRRPNAHRDRPQALEFIRSWTDGMFARQMRLQRHDFYDVLKLIHDDIAPNEDMARRSSGSSISAELQLAMTCRLLAGAEYLDMIWYRVSVDSSVWPYVDRTLRAIHARVRNVKLPFTETEVDTHIKDFQKVQQSKHGMVLFDDMVAATDGIAIERTRPSEEELGGKDYRSYLNRKGFYAWVALAIVDAFCSFILFEIRWPGATNDCTAMEQSKAMQWLKFLATIGRGVVAGDDAFSAIHALLMTPFTKSQLKRMRDHDFALYLRMRAFNNALSSQRITVERAFGILVRRFRCFKSAFERDEANSILMILVCVKLHNICVQRWKINNPHRLPGPHETFYSPDDCEQTGDDDEDNDDDVTQQLENKYIGAPRKAQQNAARLRLVESIHAKGFRLLRDDDFLVDRSV